MEEDGSIQRQGLLQPAWLTHPSLAMWGPQEGSEPEDSAPERGSEQAEGRRESPNSSLSRG